MGKQARFNVGELVIHNLFDYRGVVIDVDHAFMLSDDWYELMAKSRPPKDEPWYRVLVHNGTHETYVAQRNLSPCESKSPVKHPAISDYFSAFREGRYILSKKHTN